MEFEKKSSNFLDRFSKFIGDSVLLTSIFSFCLADVKMALGRGSFVTSFIETFKKPTTWVLSTILASGHALIEFKDSKKLYDVKPNLKYEKYSKNNIVNYESNKQYSHVEKLDFDKKTSKLTDVAR